MLNVCSAQTDPELEMAGHCRRKVVGWDHARYMVSICSAYSCVRSYLSLAGAGGAERIALHIVSICHAYSVNDLLYGIGCRAPPRIEDLDDCLLSAEHMLGTG
jgi:hypothetical protein